MTEDAKTVTDLRAHADDLGFLPSDPVRWLSPSELWRAGIKVVLSSLFANYADKREVQQALPVKALAVPADAGGELWLDFVADIGDGFDATYTVALLLVSLAPVPMGLLGPLYGVVALGSGVWFLYAVVRSVIADNPREDYAVFRVSIAYLFLLFGAMLVDRALGPIVAFLTA